MHSILVNEADLYFLAPLRIKNYQTFEANLLDAGWACPSDVPFDLYAQDALYESEAAFLGLLKDGVSPLTKDGVCFVAPEAPKEGTMIHHFRSTFKKNKYTGKPLTFSIKKKRKFESDPIWLEGLTLGNITRIHVSPDKNIAVFLLHFRLPQGGGLCQSIQQVESTNYWLHKTDEQAPLIIVDGNAIPGFETVLDMITTLINSPAEVATLYHPGRLITATYVQIPVPELTSESERDVYEEELKNHVVHIGLSKDLAYDISEDDKQETHHLFKNIMVHSSPEGFCGAFLVRDGQENTAFMEKTSTTFLKSYLPIFIETVIVELVSVNILDKKVGAKDKLNERSEQFRELKLMSIMPVSRYAHLQQLKSIISKALSITPKIETVSGYIETLREQQKQRQESIINLLIGFMGVGQVVFAILDLSRFSLDTDRMRWQVAASILSVIFGILAFIIIVIVVRSFNKKK